MQVRHAIAHIVLELNYSLVVLYSDCTDLRSVGRSTKLRYSSMETYYHSYMDTGGAVEQVTLKTMNTIIVRL
jgi:hypothetical protein